MIRKHIPDPIARAEPPQLFNSHLFVEKNSSAVEYRRPSLAKNHYCLNRNLKKSSVDARSKVRRLAAITGISFTINPYTSHMATPRQNSENIPKDRSLAERLFQVLTTCGRKAAVVNEPANKPNS